MPTQETAWDTKQYALYKHYSADNTYRMEPGVFVLPLAADEEDLAEGETPVRTVKAHAAFRVRDMKFAAKKSDAPPCIPSPESAGAFTFIGGAIRFNGPSANQTLMSWDWVVEGQYTFVEDCNSTPDDGFVLTSLPFQLETQEQNRLQYGVGNPTTGAVAVAGEDAKTGFAQASQINTQSQHWEYTSITYFPAQLLNAEMVNGELPPATE